MTPDSQTNFDSDDDPIVAEIRQIREQIAAKFNYDLHAIWKDAAERQAANSRQIVQKLPNLSKPDTTMNPKSAGAVP